MQGLLQRGNTHDGDVMGLRDEAERVADWLWEFASGTYGPHGAWKHANGVLTGSGAAALAEAEASVGGVRPYVALARSVQAARGDGGTTAILLAARWMMRLHSFHPAAALDGIALARRQTLTLLQAVATPSDTSTLLASVASLEGQSLAHSLAEQLPRLIRGGALDLDAIDLQAAAVHQPLWLAGTLLPCKHPAAQVTRGKGPGAATSMERVLFVTGDEQPTLRGGGPTATMRLTAGGTSGTAIEEAWRRERLDHVRQLGIDFIVCRGGMDEELASRLAQAGVSVATDVRKSRFDQLQMATGASACPGLLSATPAGAGCASIEPWRAAQVRRLRSGDDAIMVLVRGETGAADTWVLPTQTASHGALAEDTAERLLRSASHILLDGRGLPGGGAWQREVERRLKLAAPAAPGRSPLIIEAIASGFGDLARCLAANAGADPLDEKTGAPHVMDSLPIVEHAVDAAFDLCAMLVRIDGRLAKRPSTTPELRGGNGPVGPPSGIPFDLPADM